MSAALLDSKDLLPDQQAVLEVREAAAKAQEPGSKRPRSNSLEAAQALTQLDGPPHQSQSQAQGSFQPTLGPPQPMHPSQYANAFSAGQGPNVDRQRYQMSPQQYEHGPYQHHQQQQQHSQQQHMPNMPYGGNPMGQSPAFQPNTGNPNVGPQVASPAGGRAPGAHQTRQRTAVACRYCRKRKIRCTGISHDPNDPRCSNCRRLDQECIYAPVGAPQGNFSRGPGADAYGRGQSVSHMPQPGMPQAHNWQGYPQVSPYAPYGQGRGLPGPDGQMHYMPTPGQYAPAPGYPHGQRYQYDNSYPSYVHDINVAGPQAQGQFGRLKPETFAVYPGPTNPSQGNEPTTNVPSSGDTDRPTNDSTRPEQVQPQVEPSGASAARAPVELEEKVEEPASAANIEKELVNPAKPEDFVEDLATPGKTLTAKEPSDTVTKEPIPLLPTSSPRSTADDGMLSRVLNPQAVETVSEASKGKLDIPQG